MPGTGNQGLGREDARGREAELKNVDVGTRLRKFLQEMLNVVITRENRLALESTAHDGRQVVGVLKPKHMADLMHGRFEPLSTVLAGLPID